MVDSVAAVSLTEASRVETGTRSLLQYWLSHAAAGYLVVTITTEQHTETQ